jgi:hypothetical protein
MKRLVLECWLLLFHLEIVMLVSGFESLRRLVGHESIRAATSAGGPSREELCHAMDLACVFYFKRVLCLQRSAATVLLLRRHGWAAEMVIGAQIFPFKSHAWVEVGKVIVNDKHYMPEIYQVLERC